MSKMLKAAIADAKIVRQTAIANAKAILNEAFEPKLKKLINTKLKEELDDEKPEDGLEPEVQEDATPPEHDSEPEAALEGEDVTGATPEPEEAESDKFVKEDDELEPAPEGDPEEPVEPFGEETEPEVPGETEPESPGETEPEVKEGDENEEDKEFNIDEVIKELESEVGAEPEEKKDGEEVTEDEELKPTPDEEKNTVKEGEPGEEENLEIVPDEEPKKEGEEPAEGEDDKEVYERIIMRQRSSIREQKKVIDTYKNQLHEINLLNAKLLYTNKLFNTFPLTNREKMRVVESFDRTLTVREAKLVFASLHEAFASKTLTEHKMTKVKSSASKVVASTKPSDETQKKINESVESDETKQMREKFQRLANIKILKG